MMPSFDLLTSVTTHAGRVNPRCWERFTRCSFLALSAAFLLSVCAMNASAQEIEDVHVFRAADEANGQSSFYAVVKLKGFTSTKGLQVFVVPQTSSDKKQQPQVESTGDSQIVARFSGPTTYFPKAVVVAGGTTVVTFDVPQALDPNKPRIDDVEILALDRTLGTGRIRIDGANFGRPENVSVSITPYDPTFPAFPIVAPLLHQPTRAGDEPYYACAQLTSPGPTGAPRESPLAVQQESTDTMLVVNFSFPCLSGYSVPFQIARVVVSLKNSPSTSTSYEMLPARDKNLLYRYSILGTAQAKARFGGGISKNFYAVQLSIVNKGSKKVQIPLASIQAQVEWVVGGSDDKNYLEGPATVAPLPLTGAVSFFSQDRKSSGPRAKLFNSLQGITTIGSAVQLFFGHGFTQGVAIAGGGFRQGLGQVFQDLSDEQLANLTSQSFESIETISGNGGSIEKVIFIQRGEEVIESYTRDRKFRRLISNIDGFEITGYEVSESPAKTATPQS